MTGLKHVLITGATGGIGAATAERLASGGCHLTLVARDPRRLEALAAKLRAQGATIRTIAATLDSVTDFEALARRACESDGPVDVLVNNAAVNWFGHFSEMPFPDIAALVATDVTVPISMARAVLPGMLARGSGTIVNIGSVFGSIGFAGFPVYSACKFALRGFSEGLRRELWDQGVSVVYVAPRYTRTAFNHGAVERMAKATGMAADEPGAVARKIVRAIDRKAPERLIGLPERLFAGLNAVLPRLVDRGIARKSRLALSFAGDGDA